MKLKYLVTTLTLIALLISCDKRSPAGFWITFRKDLIMKKYSDQGPWGGSREIYWKSEKNNTFSSKELIDFAIENKWEFIDSVLLAVDSLTNESILKYKGDDYSQYIFKEKVSTKLNSNDYKIFIFNTNWLSVEPGNLSETYANGFVVLNSNGTELKVYHFWGE